MFIQTNRSRTINLFLFGGDCDFQVPSGILFSEALEKFFWKVILNIYAYARPGLAWTCLLPFSIMIVEIFELILGFCLTGFIVVEQRGLRLDGQVVREKQALSPT